MASGKWCLRTIGEGDRAVLDGSIWTLEADGDYVMEDKITTRGSWSLSADELTMSHAGKHKLIALEPDKMVLERMYTRFHLFRECGPQIETGRRVAPLRAAARKGDLLMVNALLGQGGIDIDAVDLTDLAGHTPLIAAIDGGHVDVVKHLLARGASVTVLSGTEESAFHHAALNKPEEMMPLLISKLRKPRSLDVPSFLRKTDGVPCPDPYVPVTSLGACVHSYALPRPNLDKELWDFRDGKAPMLTDWSVVSPLAEAGEGAGAAAPAAKPIDFSNPSALDPSALTNRDAPPTARSVMDNLPTISVKRSERASRPDSSWDTPEPSRGEDEARNQQQNVAVMEEFKRKLCSEYPIQLERIRSGGSQPELEQLGMTQADAEAAIQSNIRACRADGY